MRKPLGANGDWKWLRLIQGSGADNAGVMDEREGLIKWEYYCGRCAPCSSQRQGGGGLDQRVDVTCR